MNSEIFDKILREQTYSFKIDPLDRSWFITINGEIWGSISHRLMLKNRFKEEWNRLKSKDMSDGDIEKIFTNRLIQIGELDNFYCITKSLSKRFSDKIQGFCKSLLEVNINSNDKIMSILFNDGTEISSTVKEISNDWLSSHLKEEKLK